MATDASQLNERSRTKLRLWPGIVAAAMIVVGLFLAILFPIAMGDAAMIALIAAFVGTMAVFVWWLFFSRVRWLERLIAMVVLIAAWVAMRPLLDKSILGGAMGGLPFFGLTVFAVALVVWAAATRDVSKRVRGPSLVVAMLVAAGICTLVRTAGIHYGFELHWRWTPTPEDRLLALTTDEPAPLPPPSAPTEVAKAPDAVKAGADSTPVLPSPPAPAKPSEWPGFRGPFRDGIVRNVRIETDWAKSPPVEVWRRPIGPGWSSFAVDGDLIYTQEQRGEDELVASYRLSTGEPVWRHRDAVRFWESNGGAGPRGTPTLHNGRVYAFGATGILNALDARTGAVIWSRDVVPDTKVEIPTWGFSSSPLVIDDVVIIAAFGTLAGYDVATGKLRWIGPTGAFSHSSPHLITIDGVPQVLFLSGTATSVAPADGKVLWQHGFEGGAIVQPAVTADGDILVNAIAVTGGQGIRRLAVARNSDQWTVNERWRSTGLKPDCNDFVVHNG